MFLCIHICTHFANNEIVFSSFYYSCNEYLDELMGVENKDLTTLNNISNVKMKIIGLTVVCMGLLIILLVCYAAVMYKYGIKRGHLKTSSKGGPSISVDNGIAMTEVVSKKASHKLDDRKMDPDTDGGGSSVNDDTNSNPKKEEADAATKESTIINPLMTRKALL